VDKLSSAEKRVAAMKAETGKARVARILIDPLVRGGMSKSPKQNAGDHAEMLDRLAIKLAYLPEQRLRGLNEFCIRMARGRRYDIWPKEQHVLNWAYRLQPPPADWSEYVCSILRSAMGRRALDEGYHVELFETANRWGPPPTKYDISKMKWQAEENRSKRARVVRENQRGVARHDDLQWLRWFTALERQCLAIMETTKDKQEVQG
jgi:hypothetical protein